MNQTWRKFLIASLAILAAAFSPVNAVAAEKSASVVPALTLLDIDGNGVVDAMTDGLIAIRYLIGITGDPLIANALGQGATRTTPEQIIAYLQSLTTPIPTSELVVSKSGFGTGTVTSVPPGISCGTDCAETYPQTTYVSLTATPDAGSVFDGWTGGGCSGKGQCVVTMEMARSITAVFVSVCDAGLASNSTEGADYAKAIELCETTTEMASTPGLISATLSLASAAGTPAIGAYSIRNQFGSGNAPESGSSMIVLSTGKAASSAQPGYVAPQPGYIQGTSSSAPADWLSANGGTFPHRPGCPSPGSLTAYDPVMLTLRVRVPATAHAFRISAKYFSADFPEWVCTNATDMFVALLTSSYQGMPPNPADKNVATYGVQRFPLDVNLAFDTGLFTQCVNGPIGCSGSATANITTCTGTAGLTGTGFDVIADSCSTAGQRTGGGTDWLTIQGNVVPGEIITLRFAIWDTADGLFDSTVLLDNFQWMTTNVTPGMFPN